MHNTTAKALDWTEQGLVPDSVIRHGIRRLLKTRISEINADNIQLAQDTKSTFIQSMNQSPIAPQSHKANEQHYELPTEFFMGVLGNHSKYSCCYWDDATKDLDSAEEKALHITCKRADLKDGLSILELGCGWGSLTLWMAKQYPNSQITAISNSSTQREHILKCAEQQQLGNIRVLTYDMNDFHSPYAYDRIVSVEMFEHMRNYKKLFYRVNSWLKPGGRFFMHIFCHRDVPYSFTAKDDSDWMSKHFFSGGMMPSDDLPLYFQEDLSLLRKWRWDGQHYEKTSNAWLANMDINKKYLWPIIEHTYGKDFAQQWWMRWRMFFMACAELFGYDNGQQWWVSHYLFEKRTLT